MLLQCRNRDWLLLQQQLECCSCQPATQWQVPATLRGDLCRVAQGGKSITMYLAPAFVRIHLCLVCTIMHALCPTLPLSFHQGIPLSYSMQVSVSVAAQCWTALVPAGCNLRLWVGTGLGWAGGFWLHSSILHCCIECMAGRLGSAHECAHGTPSASRFCFVRPPLFPPNAHSGTQLQGALMLTHDVSLPLRGCRDCSRSGVLRPVGRLSQVALAACERQ